MKRALLVIGIIVQLAASQSSFAYTFGDTQNYFPTWASTSDPSDNSKDVIGHPNITGGTATIAPDITLSQITFNQDPTYRSWSDLYTTDLFINVLSSENDTTWDYIVQGGHKAAGDYAIYDIRGVGLSAIKGVSPISDYILTSSTELSVRNDHPIAVSEDLLNTRYSGNPYGISQIGTAHFSGLTDALTTTYDFNNGTFSLGTLGFVIGWGVDCANDVIYEQVPVPEPATMMLFGLGMLGMAVYGKRRMNKNA